MGVVGEAVVGELVKNLISLVEGEVSLLRSVEGNVESLSSKLTTIQAVLADAENTQFKNKAITVWLRNLKNAVYDAEDVLDEWIAGTPQVVNTGCMDQVSNSVSACFNLNRIRFRHKIANKLTEILSRFDEIAAEKSKFDLKISDGQRSEPLFDKSRETTSSITEPCVYGRDVDKENVTLELLKHVGTQDDVFVLPIIGMGGMGKTTLAQMVFNDKKVIAQFEVRSWVCVSYPFDIERILKALIEASITDASNEEPCDLKSLESIKNKVQKILKGKRYLIVLDDVWNESQSEWNKLKSFLKGGAQGSSIILTTRLEGVASITSIVEPYTLGVLSDDDSWALLRQYAFGGRGEEEYPGMVGIGKEITKKCKGVPLALKSLGSLLWKKGWESMESWKSIRDSEMWELKQDKDPSILPALKLSYNHLPSCLKLCFAYCSVFPKDYAMNKELLVHLWIANGFIQSQESRQPEEVGDDIVNELLRRSFFQEGKEDDNGNIETCKIHDLMCDLAISFTLDECLAVDESTKHVPKTIRHLRVRVSPESSTLANTLLTPHSSLRTLLFFDSINFDFDSFEFSSTLRVLDLSGMQIKKLPPSILHLKLLRYLDLSANEISLLPESICKLRNLQMLDLSYNEELETLPSSIVKLETLRYLNLSCTSIASLPESFQSLKSLRCLYLSRTDTRSLPESIFMLTNLHRLDLSWNRKIKTLPPAIGKLVNLRHLSLCYCSSLDPIPEIVCDLTNLHSLLVKDDLNVYASTNSSKIPIGIGKLISLQTLGDIPFIVGKPERDSGGVGVGINELQRLNQLRGELKIVGLENVRNAEEARTANLGSKQYLNKLVLFWYDSDSDDGNNRSKEVLEGILHPHPPPNLQSLEIYKYGAEEFPPQTFLGRGILNRNRTLRSLKIWGCKNLKSLPAEIGHLTALTSLHIQQCEKLASLPQEMQKLTSLRNFEIVCCNIKCLPVIGGTGNSISSLLDLKIEGCWNLSSMSEGLCNLTSLQQLEISDCRVLRLVTQEEEEEDGFQHLISLKKLLLKRLPKLRALPEGIQHLSMLETLEILECKNLASVPQKLQKLTSLTSFTVTYCEIKCLPVIGGTNNSSLLDLEIKSCWNLTSVSEGLRYLTSLQRLQISNCLELELVTEEEDGDCIQHIISLQNLVLEDLPQLRALPEGIQCLSMLKTLQISQCKNLRELPEWLMRLTTLQTLELYSSHPDLEARCKNDEGEDWQKISRIPNVKFR